MPKVNASVQSFTSKCWQRRRSRAIASQTSSIISKPGFLPPSPTHGRSPPVAVESALPRLSFVRG
ncbi:MAG: hypothetical protein EBE86_014610 [Hormoscilla sp. GUM202]|nr:hypothetical protein [Hormoscilla sp. GUM202]